MMDSIKGAFIKSALSHVTDGDKGSTLLGVVGGGLLAANIDWGKVSRGFHDQESAIECGKAVGIALILSWGYYIGKRGKPQSNDQTSSAAAGR